MLAALSSFSGGAIISGFLSFVGATIVLRLWNANLRVPFSYVGDSLAVAMYARDLQSDPNYLFNPDLGWPDSQHIADVPQGADNLHFISMWFIGLFTDNWAVVLNVFFVATFVLVAVAGYAALRLQDISAGSSIAGGILFSFLPYHFAHGEPHLFLSAYYMVPFAVLVLLWQMSETTCLIRTATTLEDGRRTRVALTLITCVVLGATGAYYAAFYVMLALSCCTVVAFAMRSMRIAASAMVTAGVVVASVIGNITPTLIYWASQGGRSGFGRVLGEAEVYGLKISSLFIPVGGHRWQPVAEASQKLQTSFLTSESGMQVGLLPAAGIVFLLIFGFFRIIGGWDSDQRRIGRVSHLALVIYVALFIATIGGFSTFIGAAGFTTIRVYSRIAVIVGFVGIVAFAMGMDAARRRYRSLASPAAIVFLPVLVMVVGVFDQTTPGDVPQYEVNAKQFASDEAFVSSAERALPTRGTVLQIPVLPFPESPSPGFMTDYDHLRGYLHSERLRFSYGAIKGRDDWQIEYAGADARVLTRMAQAVGYDAIWVDRNGFTDRGRDIEAGLGRLLGDPIAESPDKRLVLYRVGGNASPTIGALERQLALSPVAVTPSGFVTSYQDGEEISLPSVVPNPSLTLTNNSGRSRVATVAFGIASVARAGGRVRIEVSGSRATFDVSPDTLECTVRVNLRPGQTVIQLTYDGPVGSVPAVYALPGGRYTPYLRTSSIRTWDAFPDEDGGTPTILC